MDLLAPGQLFADRYRVERPLARGGMGAVYVAHDLESRANVALKVLLPHVVSNERARGRFRHEAEVAARMRSAHIVRVHDAGLDASTDMPFLIMELLEGHSLFDLVTESGACSRHDTVLYIQHVARGLDSAHGFTDLDGVARPVVHRDLKPDNLFLTRHDDDSPLVKILDFGLAKVASQSAVLSQDVKGTPEYMAFEQLRGEPVSPQTDVWALGLVAFFLLSGRSYWRTVATPDSTVQALFTELLAPHKPPPSERIRELGGCPRWPRAFDPWFLHCVAAEPTRRFASAGEAARELEWALLHSPESRLDSHPAGGDAADREAPLSAQPTMVTEPTRPLKPPPHKYDSPSDRGTTRPWWPTRKGIDSSTPGRMFDGDAEQGFEVRALPERRVVRLEYWGAWSEVLAARYVEAVRAAMQTMADGRPWYVLIQSSRYPHAHEPLAALHGALVQEAATLGMTRACTVVDSNLSPTQIRHLAQEHRLPEAACFRNERAAVHWLTRS